MAVLSIQYTGGEQKYDENDEPIGDRTPIKYKSVTLTSYVGEKRKTHKFKSGNFVKDWYDAKKLFITTYDNEPLMGSSTCDHFIMDGADFDSGYLHMNGKIPILKYVDREDKYWFLKKEDDGYGIWEGIEFFVESGTKPTWEELKELCDDLKQKV